jgi:hypothetical protein
MSGLPLPDKTTIVSPPSERAYAEAAYVTGGTRTPAPTAYAHRKALEAAHDPALGLDRSVCLRDVLAMLNDGCGWPPGSPEYKAMVQTAALIEQGLTGA